MEWPPIVEKMYELNRWLLPTVGKFPRDQQFLLGQRLAGKSLDILEKLVAVAVMRNGEEKNATLHVIDVELEQLRYLIRLAGEGRCMSRTSWHFCAGRLAEIGKMMGGWIKSSN